MSAFLSLNVSTHIHSKTLFGQMGEEMLLGGVRAVPKKLLESGFEFHHPTIDKALISAIREESI